MASKVAASIVVDFGVQSSSSGLSAELDEVRNGGKTSFSIGDTIAFRVFNPAGIVYAVDSSDGFIVKLLTGSVEKVFSETLQFIRTNKVAPSKVPAQIDSLTMPEIKWYGATGAVYIEGENLVAANYDDKFLGIGEVKYASRFDVWQLLSPSTTETEYKVVIDIREV